MAQTIAERGGQLAPQALVVQSVGVLIGSPSFIAGKLPWFRPVGVLRMHPLDEVRETWIELREYLVTRLPDLLPFVDLAVIDPQLGTLFPFLAHDQLCLSKYTAYPYYVDFIVAFDEPNTFLVRVTTSDGNYCHSKTVGSGSADQAIVLLASLIPADYGPAVSGDSSVLLS